MGDKAGIFYLDDSEVLTKMFKLYFEKNGFDVTVSNYISEEEYSSLQKYDFIFIDLNLGSENTHNGSEICTILKKRDANLKVYIISSQRDFDVGRCGADGFIEKTPQAYTIIQEIIKKEITEDRQ